MSPRRNNGVVVEVLAQSFRWKRKPHAQAMVRKAIQAAADAIPSASGQVAVVLTDDTSLKKLNRRWRGINKPTNVLSFPTAARQAEMLGDIAIAYETLARECRVEHKEFDHHLAHLAIHGFLHLMGYDHQTDSDAEAMEKMERDALARLRMPDPYLARGALNT